MPDLYAVIGHPIDHSLSPQIHAEFARQTGQDMHYVAIDGGDSDASFRQAVAVFVQRGGRGLNVTLPFKLAALQLADSQSDEARLAGAANTLVFAGGKVHAHNTDGLGLVRDIVHTLGFGLADKRALVLGAGGATRGILLPLANAGLAQLHIANRTATKADALAQEFAAHLPALAWQASGLDGLAAAGAFDLVINATSVSLGGSALDLPSSLFGSGALAYDLVYGRGLTPFLRTARQAGVARLADGLGMLVEQAAESFACWRGLRPQTQTVRQLLQARTEQP